MFYIETPEQEMTTEIEASNHCQPERTNIEELYQWLDRPVTEEEIVSAD